MGVTFTKAGDMAELNAGFLLFGDPGAGKTHACSTAPAPFVVLTERNGMTTIKRANPDAVVAMVTNVADLREVLGMARDGRLPHGCRTLVVDSLTEVQRLFKDEIMAGKRAGEKFSLQDWGTLTDKMRHFMRTLRDVPYNVVATCLAEAQVSDADGVRYVRPAFEGKKTSAEVAQYFNGVAYVFKRMTKDDQGKDVALHRAMFDGPSNYVTKACHPLAGVIETDVGQWFALLDGNTNSAAK